MHEISIVMEVVNTVEKIAIKQQLTKIDTLVLQIGEISSIVPKYIKECYKAAADGTILEDTKLKIEIIPGNAMCKKCRKVFNLLKEGGKCPDCRNNNFELLSGKEFMIKEIIAY